MEGGARVTSDDDAVIAEVMQEILAYLCAHPQARDTTEGILQWWLPQDREGLPVSEVREAVERLAAAELIRTERLPGGAVLCSGIEASQRKDR
jgi:hypothetical protein